ncbi:MAG: hypothetical protein HY519_03255 [Candidatus Aenigmarchaeota archaeon]|nr:hypothetical protein [Candidatus Aenigmarchaeota archaeon]
MPAKGEMNVVFYFVIAFVVGLSLFAFGVVRFGSVLSSDCWNGVSRSITDITGESSPGFQSGLGSSYFTEYVSTPALCLDRILFKDYAACRKACDSFPDQKACRKECTKCANSNGCIAAIPKRTGVTQLVTGSRGMSEPDIVKQTGANPVVYPTDYGFNYVLVAKEGVKGYCLEFALDGAFYQIQELPEGKSGCEAER